MHIDASEDDPFYANITKDLVRDVKNILKINIVGIVIIFGGLISDKPIKHEPAD